MDLWVELMVAENSRNVVAMDSQTEELNTAKDSNGSLSLQSEGTKSDGVVNEWEIASI